MSQASMSPNERYALQIVTAVNSLFQSEEGEHPELDLETLDATEFFTGFLKAFNYILNQLTGSDDDLLDTLAVMQRLAFQTLKPEATADA